MKLLTFSTLFPNVERPNFAVFVETRLRKLVASGEVESRVVAPIPWFPFQHQRFGRYGTFAKVPMEEVRFGLKVTHPRYPLPPTMGMTIAPFLLANAVKPRIRRIIDEGYDFDAIDAHYFYPDGVAAAMLGQHFKKPVVITARGSDISLIPKYRLPRKMIVWAAKHADGVITVCNALKTEMINLGISADRIVSLRNGVDLQYFQPIDRKSIRQELKLSQFTLLSVGNLIPLKGHDLVIKALPMLPDTRLLIAGSGPESKSLKILAQRLNVEDRVSFLGTLPQVELRKYYGAADILVLASSSEGWANVLLESMACGTPVVASNVWGTPEVVAAPEAGLLMRERTPDAMVQAVRNLRSRLPDRKATRQYAERFSWDATTAGQLQLFKRILDNPSS
jgi:teichuronic acid biosynthesis glycosyltransferase TuaC